MKRTILGALLGAVLVPAGAWSLGLDAYLDQVRQGNPGLRGAQAEDAAFSLSADQPLTAFSPQLNGHAQREDDQEIPAGSSELSPSDTQTISWDANLSKLFSTGTQVSLDYSGDKTNFQYPGMVASLLSNPEYAGFLPFLDTYGQQWNINVSQSLWRNFGASQVDANLDKAKADADENRAGNLYQAQATLFQARQAYNALETARLAGDLYRQSFQRDQEILRWTVGKYNDNLADEADVLESKAALAQASFDLDQNQEDQAKAALLFNSLRGRNPADAVEGLEILSDPEALPPAKGERRDLEAAEAALRSSDAEVRAVVQSYTPDISVFAQVGAAERTQAEEEGFEPDTLVGLKFSANLDFLLYHRILAGARQAEGYGQAQVQDKRLVLARDWADLKAGFEGVRQRLSLARQIEALQQRKAAREKDLYLDGRTTHFQVLRAESDYDVARVQTLNLSAQARDLAAEARYYNGDDRPW